MATYGATAPASHTYNFDALLSTTLSNYAPTMADNIYKASAFLAAMKQKGGVEYVDGGHNIVYPLMYEENGTAKSYDGYELLDTTPQDGMTTAQYKWAQLAATIAISRKEERQNNGEAQILNLLEKKTMQAEMSLKSLLGGQVISGTASSNVFVPGNSGKDVNPLAYFLPKANATDPSGTGIDTVGGLSRSTYSWWRPVTAVGDSATLDTGNSFALSISTWKGVALGLKRLYNYCSRGADGSGPNIFVLSQAIYEEYENSMDDKLRYGDTAMADLGFDTIKCKGATCLWDERVPNVDEGYTYDDASFTTNNKQGTAFAVNTKFLKIVTDRETDFITTPFTSPENQAAKVAKVLWMGQMCSSNMRKHGVLYALSSTIAS